MTEISIEENTSPTETVSKCEADSISAGSTDMATLPPFPEVGPQPLCVATNVGAHTRESDPAVGCTRLKVLTPFALARLGRKYQVWDNAKGGLVDADAPLPIRPYAKMLAGRLACGTDLIFQWVNLLCKRGPENVVAEDLLKVSTTSGKGTSRLAVLEEEALQKATYQVCVYDGMKPASKAANKAIREHLIASSVTRRIGTATIKARSLSAKITTARTDAYQRDHLMRLAGHPDEVTSLNEVVVLDTTQFTDDDYELRVVDSQGRDLGPANVIFAILKANRGVWSFRAFAGAANGYLAGLTIKRGLISKEPLLTRYGIKGIWPLHGKIGTANHDRGKEFINDLVRRVVKSRDIGIVDYSPPKTPHYRGDLERFNRTAHLLFREFLNSDYGTRYLRSVNGRPTAKGILLNDLDRALIEWIVGYYHVRPNAGLGGDSPMSRMEKFVLGQNGLPASGLPMALADTDELAWDFLWEETRVVNHLGITFAHRRYVNAALAGLFKLRSRSSERKIAFRFNPYAMGLVYVKIAGADDREQILPVKWLPETEKYRPRREDEMASINPSLWEWDALFKDIRRGNTEASSCELAEALHAEREREAEAGKTMAGAPAKRTRVADARNREMRNKFGQENLPKSNGDQARVSPEGSAGGGPGAKPDSEKKRGREKCADPKPTLLQTGCGADEY